MQYGLWLSICKVIFEGLTAFFGILGLVSEFKNDETKKITPTGRLALVGIIASFIVSGVITVLERKEAATEAQKHNEEEVQHQKELTRLARPTRDVSAAIVLAAPLSSAELVEVVKETKRKPAEELPYNSSPKWFRQTVTKFFSSDYELELFKQKRTCDESIVARKGDITLQTIHDYSQPLAKDALVRLDAHNLLVHTRAVFHAFYNSNLFTSVEDVPGSSAVIKLTRNNQITQIDTIALNINGSVFDIPREKLVPLGGMADNYDNFTSIYCYTFPPLDT